VPGVKMPDESRLPPGPRRDLVAGLHELYSSAGKPACRRISVLIRERDVLPGTLSHEGVSATLRGAGGLPRWHNLESLVRVLAELSVIGLDVNAVVVRIHSLWCAAGDPSMSLNLASGEAPSSVAHLDLNSLTVKPGDAKEDPNSDIGSSSHVNQESNSVTHQLLARWNPQLSALDVFDRQTAIDIARGLGESHE
jgi:hypothetical protein